MPLLSDKPFPAGYSAPHGGFAIDTETTSFNEPSWGWKQKTRIAPFGGHEFIIGSIAGAGRTRVCGPASFEAALSGLLDAKEELIFHNAAFDVPLILRTFPALVERLLLAVEAGRVHDTKLFHMLLQIARGSRRIADIKLVVPKLADLAVQHLGLRLNKDETIRCGFHNYKGRVRDLPQAFLDYAAQDAFATYFVYQAQRAQGLLTASSSRTPYPVHPEATARWGLLTEAIQVKASIAFAWLEQFPLRVDVPAAEARRDALHAELDGLKTALVLFGWASVTPRSKQFRFGQKRLRAFLDTFCKERAILPEYTNSGLISLEHDFWAEHIDPATPEEVASPATAVTDDARLRVWLRFLRVQKLLNTYIYPYASSPIHYPSYRVLGARTSRTSCTRPNAQNISKRRDGIRSLFIPPPDEQLYEVDLVAAELASLAQVYHSLYGGSPLGDAINAGRDPHIETARRLTPTFDALPEKEQKRLRQCAKAVNFGYPGGLGAAKFCKYAHKSFRVSLTLEQSKELRAQALAADPALSSYLANTGNAGSLFNLAAKNLGLLPDALKSALSNGKYPREDGWGPPDTWFLKKLRAWARGEPFPSLSPPPGFNPRFDLFRSPTSSYAGLIRGNASYTECRNTPFQALTAAGAKLGLWNVFRLWRRRPVFSPMAFVHDSFLFSCLPDFADCVPAVAEAFRLGQQEVCPDVRCAVEIAGPLERWGASTDHRGANILKESANA